ncbi:MAG: DUF5597 domain-containing protein [Bacteroidales bacterium]|nr:DUF5597 domain-containing protein [Bacteroidales bacterium]
MCLSLGMQAQKAELRDYQGTRRLFWRGEPFLMLSGELHNSTSSSLGYLSQTMESLRAMHLNSVIVTVEWDQLEPREGVYDFTMVDHIIDLSEKLQMPVAIAWFGTWKNGVSSYIPTWMKADPKRFFRVKNDKGESTDTISPFCMAAKEADKKAFTALMKHIAQRDRNNMVLMMQVENEIGLWTQSIDHGTQAQKAFSGKVPSELISFLQKNAGSLSSPIAKAWLSSGSRTSGTWKEVFGESDDTEAFFMAWHFASYVEDVAAAGKAQYDIPMFMNTVAMSSSMPMPPAPPQAAAPAGQGNGQGNGQGAAPQGATARRRNPNFPSGAPVANAIDIYHAAAPSIDFFSPDIYMPAFKAISDDFTRKDNPLFIPETSRNASPAYYAFANNDAIGFSAFAVEDAFLDRDYVGTYATLSELLPIISKYQGTGKMKGFVREMGSTGETISLDGYTVNVKYVAEESRAFGLVVKTGEDEFLLSGIGCLISISKDDPKAVSRYDYVQEGHFEGEKWVSEVLLNGDQTSHGQEVYLRGRMEYAEGVTLPEGQVFPKRNVASSETRQDIVTSRPKDPSVYMTRVFTYPK